MHNKLYMINSSFIFYSHKLYVIMYRSLMKVNILSKEYENGVKLHFSKQHKQNPNE